DRQFRRYFIGAFCSVQAIWIQRVCLAWLAWERTGSAGFVGVAAGLSLAPTLFAGPVFGVMADRVDIRRAAQGTTVAMMATLVIMALTAPGLGPVGIALAALVIGSISAAHHPVRMSLGPRIVARDLVPFVVAAQALNFNIARLVAPAITGALIAWIGVPATLWIAVVALLPMQIVLIGLRPRPLPPRPARPILRDMRDALAYILGAPQVRFAFVLTIIFATLVRGALELLPVLADGVFARGAGGLGVLTGAAGAGALLTAGWRAVSAGAITGQVPASVMAAGFAALAATLGMGLATSWPLLLVLTAAAGGMSTWCGVTLQAAIQAGLPDEMRGRVMSFWIVVGFGLAAVGAFGIGALAELVGIGTALVAAGALGLAAQAFAVLGGVPRRAIS
ncbi:MAG: MFS transporter, partial [Pseudomonadota bacterium]